MVKFIRQGVYYAEGRLIKESQAFMTSDKKARAIRNTASYAVLSEYFRGEELSLPVSRVAMGEEEAKNVFCTLDAMGIRELPVPCAVFASAWGDPDFLFSASKRYGVRVVTGGLYPAEGYVREQLVRTGEILLGTQYFPCGALGALSVVDDEGAVLRTLMGAPYAVPKPATAAVYIKGKLRKGVGPTDVALSILKTLMTSDIAEGKLLEVFGPGLSDLSMDSRNQIDSWLRRTGCFGTLWAADGKTKGYFEVHARGEDYKSLAPAEPAYYDCGAVVDLSRIEPMIAFRGHIFPVREAMEDPAACGLCAEGETPRFTDFRIGGMCGTYETLAEVAEIVRKKHIGADANFTVLPVSAPVEQALMQNGYAAALLSAGILTGRNFGAMQRGFLPPTDLFRRTAFSSMHAPSPIPPSAAESSVPRRSARIRADSKNIPSTGHIMHPASFWKFPKKGRSSIFRTGRSRSPQRSRFPKISPSKLPPCNLLRRMKRSLKSKRRQKRKIPCPLLPCSIPTMPRVRSGDRRSKCAQRISAPSSRKRFPKN